MKTLKLQISTLIHSYSAFKFLSSFNINETTFLCFRNMQNRTEEVKFDIIDSDYTYIFTLISNELELNKISVLKIYNNDMLRTNRININDIYQELSDLEDTGYAFNKSLTEGAFLDAELINLLCKLYEKIKTGVWELLH